MTTAHRWRVEVDLDATHDEAVEVARQLERLARRLRARTEPIPELAASERLIPVAVPLDREVDWVERVRCTVEELVR